MDVKYSISDTKKTKKEFDWSPKYEFKKGIKETIMHYNENE